MTVDRYGNIITKLKVRDNGDALRFYEDDIGRLRLVNDTNTVLDACDIVEGRNRTAYLTLFTMANNATPPTTLCF